MEHQKSDLVVSGNSSVMIMLRAQAATMLSVAVVTNLAILASADVGVQASIADTVSSVYNTITGKEKGVGEQASAIAWDVAMGNWEKAVQEAKDLAKHFGSGSSDSEEMKLKAYEQYLRVKHTLQNAYNQALSAEPEGDEKEELGDAKRKLYNSYDEASSALDSAAVAAKIVIKKLLEKGSEYAGYAKDKAGDVKDSAVDYGHKASDAYEYAGEKKDEAMTLMKRLANMAMNYGHYASDKVKDAYDSAGDVKNSAKDAVQTAKKHVGGAKDSAKYGAEKTMETMRDAGHQVKNVYEHMPDMHRQDHHHHDYDAGHREHEHHDHHSLLQAIDKSMWHLPCFLLTLGIIGCAVFAYQTYERYEQQRRRGTPPTRRVVETTERTRVEPGSHSRGTDPRHSHEEEHVRRREVH